MIKSIPVGAKVICTDGPGGRTTALIVDPQSRSLTHIAVVEQSILHGEERLVPIERVVKTTRDAVHLNCTSGEILEMEPFTDTHYLEMEYGEEGYAYSLPYMSGYSDVTMSPELTYLTVQDELVPSGEIAIHRGMTVESTDGPVGRVGELLIDSPSGQITHFLLMKGHRWGKKEVAITVSAIDRIEEETIYLKIDQAEIDQLPSLPVRRQWEEVLATDLELMVWVFKEKNQAQLTLKRVQELCKQYALTLFNATVIEKDKQGETHVYEDKELPSKRRITLGIALGGLAGLFIGPVALAAGAIAGAVAGRKSAKKVEVGFSEDKLRKLNEHLVPGGSALVLLVEHRWFHTLQAELAENGGQLIHERLSNLTYDELVERLSAVEKED